MIGAKGWQNPYLIIKPAGVALLDPDNHEEILFKPEELTQALGKLPASAWPYGRVVAVTENAVKVAGDDVPIRSHIFTLAHKQTRECLREEHCALL